MCWRGSGRAWRLPRGRKRPGTRSDQSSPRESKATRGGSGLFDRLPSATGSVRVNKRVHRSCQPARRTGIAVKAAVYREPSLGVTPLGARHVEAAGYLRRGTDPTRAAQLVPGRHTATAACHRLASVVPILDPGCAPERLDLAVWVHRHGTNRYSVTGHPEGDCRFRLRGYRGGCLAPSVTSAGRSRGHREQEHENGCRPRECLDAHDRTTRACTPM